MKDNFDLRQFLVENKLTETSRAKSNTRAHFKQVILNENVHIAADPDNEMLDEARIDRDALYKEFNMYASKYGEDKAWKMIRKFHPEVDFDAINIIPRFARQNKKVGDAQDQARLNRSLNRGGAEYAQRDNIDFTGERGYTGEASVDDKGRMDRDVYKLDQRVVKSEGCGMKHNMNEAGYGDDDDYVADDDLDFTAGDSLVSLIGGKDRKAKAAAEKAMKKDTDFDDYEEKFDEPEVDDEENFEDPEDIDAASVKDVPDLASTIKYDPETVELQMDPKELDEYLNDFRRPQVAAKVLNRAIKAAQAEADEYGYKTLYIVLNKGFYETRRFIPSNLLHIATVHAHKEK